MSQNIPTTIVSLPSGDHFICNYTGEKCTLAYGILIPGKNSVKRVGAFLDPLCAVAFINYLYAAKNLKADLVTKYMDSIKADLGLTEEQQLIQAPDNEPSRGQFWDRSYQSNFPWMMPPIDKYISVESVIADRDEKKKKKKSTAPKELSIYQLGGGRAQKLNGITKGQTLKIPSAIKQVSFESYKNKACIVLGNGMGKKNEPNQQVDSVFGHPMNLSGDAFMLITGELENKDIEKSIQQPVAVVSGAPVTPSPETKKATKKRKREKKEKVAAGKGKEEAAPGIPDDTPIGMEPSTSPAKKSHRKKKVAV